MGAVAPPYSQKSNIDSRLTGITTFNLNKADLKKGKRELSPRKIGLSPRMAKTRAFQQTWP
jgi:hypothetical protein